jgi:diguanylate cyclase
MTLAGPLTRRERCALRLLIAVAAGIVAATGVHAVFGLGGKAAEALVRDWASSALYVVVTATVWLRALRTPSKRTPWVVFAIGLSLYAMGNVLWTMWLEHVPRPPIPSVCDALWLSLYPLSYIGIAGLAGVRRRALPAGVWLDGIVAGLGIAALGAAAVFPAVLASAKGRPIAVATELAYPVGDLLLAALVVGVLALRDWRVDRMWALLGGGFIVLAVADCMYALQVAGGTDSTNSSTNFFYMTGVLLLALAAWQRETETGSPAVHRWSVLLMPAAFTLGALGLLAYGQVDHLHPLAYTLALLTLLAAVVRTGLTFRDVRALAETRRQARIDELTSLANRRQLLHSVEQAITASRQTGDGVALLMIDLDHFKEINDTLGHPAGDRLLSQIGPRLRTALRRGDTVGRLGGDEFCVVLTPGDDVAALVIAEKIRAAIEEPFPVEGLDLRVSASIGIAHFPANAANANELLKRADVAMYQAKTSRTGRQVYARDRAIDPGERLELAGELARGIDNGELEVHYQPQADARSRRIVGVEALVRWRHPDRGLLGPFEFIGVAEQAGVVRELTRTVLNASLDQLHAWRTDGHDLRLAVNVTAADLLDAKFPAEVETALVRRGLPLAALVLELAESSIAADPVRIGHALAQLGERGIGLSLNGFGSGRSSLVALRAIPVGEVKVDRTVVARMTSDPIDAAIVCSTVTLAHRLGMRVTAEGVEDEATAAAVLEAGCQVLQGYLLAEPLPAKELERQLNTTSTTPVIQKIHSPVGI